MNREIISSLVYGYATKNRLGFTELELHELLLKIPNADPTIFWRSFYGTTCTRVDNEIIHYHTDVVTSLLCSIEKRDMLPSEFD